MAVVLGAISVPIGLIVYDAAERQLDTRLAELVVAIEADYSAAIEAGRVPDPAALGARLGPQDALRIEPIAGAAVTAGASEPARSTRAVSQAAADGAVITVRTDADPLDDNFRRQVKALLWLALGALGAAAALAAVQARQLARPLERLSARAGRIGDGDFSAQRFAPTGIPEIDDIGAALDVSARRVDDMLASERHITADITHQLRTGITGIAMRFEILTRHPDREVAAEATTGLEQTDQLNATIDDLLAAARRRGTDQRVVFDATQVVAAHVDEWRPRFDRVRRHLAVVVVRPAPPVVGTIGLFGQVIDILIDNALHHGTGTVTVMIDGADVVVVDQGPGIAADRLDSVFEAPADPAARHGRGLPLARRLAQADGATLEVIDPRPLRLRLRLVRGDPAA
ncbi:MAG TPA: HAMP domain-containing sensor histidine kinase [Ilumatobacter sp.]